MEEGASGWTNQGRTPREPNPEREDEIQEVGSAQGSEWEREHNFRSGRYCPPMQLSVHDQHTGNLPVGSFLL